MEAQRVATMSLGDLYTIILDYKGGTYISQVTADSPEAAVNSWVTAANEQDLAHWNLTRKELAELSEDRMISIDGCQNVWCASGSAKSGLMLLNIVATRT